MQSSKAFADYQALFTEVLILRNFRLI